MIIPSKISQHCISQNHLSTKKFEKGENIKFNLTKKPSVTKYKFHRTKKKRWPKHLSIPDCTMTKTQKMKTKKISHTYFWSWTKSKTQYILANILPTTTTIILSFQFQTSRIGCFGLGMGRSKSRFTKLFCFGIMYINNQWRRKLKPPTLERLNPPSRREWMKRRSRKWVLRKSRDAEMQMMRWYVVSGRHNVWGMCYPWKSFLHFVKIVRVVKFWWGGGNHYVKNVIGRRMWLAQGSSSTRLMMMISSGDRCWRRVEWTNGNT